MNNEKHINLYILGVTALLLMNMVIVGFVGFNFYQTQKKVNQRTSLFEHPADRYYAVFLTNQQVYFGHITQETVDTIVLKDAYYIKADTTLTAQPTTVTNTNSIAAKISLVKLGKELHSPKDQISINREHVLFYEEMDKDGPIMEAIKQNETSQK